MSKLKFRIVLFYNYNNNRKIISGKLNENETKTS